MAKSKELSQLASLLTVDPGQVTLDAKFAATAGTAQTDFVTKSQLEVAVAGKDNTDEITEGSTNLYFTNTRVGAYLTANNYATQSYVGTQLANLVDSSPATLDTLNELAAALGDDPNFATTTATAIGLKAPLASPSFTGVVGIGIDTPAATLHVKRTSGNAGIYVDYNATNVGRIEAASNGNLYIGTITGAGSVSLGNTADANLIFLTPAGAVGIGTVNPSAKLAVQGTGFFSGNFTAGMSPAPFWNIRATDYSGTGGLYIGSVKGGNSMFLAADSYYNNSFLWHSKTTTSTVIDLFNNEIAFKLDSGLTPDTNFTPTTKVIIKADGKVGINTYSPKTKLDINTGSDDSGGRSTVNAFRLATPNNDGMEWYLDHASNSYSGWVATAKVNNVGSGWGDAYLQFDTAGLGGGGVKTLTLKHNAITLGSDAGAAGTGYNVYTRLAGSALSNGSADYGNWGGLIFHSTSNMSASSRRWLITNSLDVNKLAFIRSVDATTDPSVGYSGSSVGTVTSGTLDMVIDSLGQVAFGGVSNPARQFTISRPTEAQNEQLEFRVVGGISDGNYGGIVWTQNSAGSTALASLRLNYKTSGSPDMAFNLRSDSNALYLKAGGNVGVSTSNPVDVFSVVTGSGFSWQTGFKRMTGSPDAGGLFYTTDNSGWMFHIGKLVGGSTYTKQLTIVDNGNVGINETNPGYKLAVNGTMYASQGTFGGSTATDVQFGVNGTAHNVGIWYHGGTIGQYNTWSSKQTSSSGTHTLDTNQFIITGAGYGNSTYLTINNSGIDTPKAIYANGGVYRRRYSYLAPGTKGSYVWVRAQMGAFNSGGNTVKLSVQRSIHNDGSSPYGGPSADFIIHSREWHNRQECCTVYYSEHGDVSGAGGKYISHAGPRDLAGSGYWFYMRVAAGITYEIYVDSDCGYVADFDSNAQTDPGSVPEIKVYGFNILGSNGNSADLYVQNNAEVAGYVKTQRSQYGWYTWGGNPGGTYHHIKTSLWAGSGVPGNSQPTMSLFHIKGYNYNAETIDSMIGFHNWSGTAYNLRMTNAGYRACNNNVYQSADGYIVLVIDTGTNYPGIVIDYHQNYPYTYQYVTVQAASSSTSTSGVY